MDKRLWPFLFLLVMKYDMTTFGQNCGSDFTATTAGEIVSPEFPGNYPGSLNCSWTIEVSQSLDFVVELTIEEFEVEDSELCLNDYLTVYDGSSVDSPVILPPSCGSRIVWPAYPPTLRSTSRIMTIMFTSNDVISAGGFRATFKQVEPRDDFFIVADKTNHKIYKQDRFSVTSQALPVFGLLVPVAVDFDPVERKVYFTDVGTKFIGRIDIDGSNQETLVTSHIGVPDGIAVDYVTRNMYWTDTDTDTISVARLDGTYRRILVDENLYEPRDIIVQPNQGYIYWSDWGTFPKIEKSHGDGSNRILIVSLGLGWPNGIALDEIENKLYWADAKLNRIERCNLDGSQRELLKHFGTDVHPFGLVVVGDGIYWTDWSTEGIDVADRNFEEEPSTLIVNGVRTRFHGLAYHSSIATTIPVKDCSLGQLNSGCDELCVLVPSGSTCLAVSPIFDTCPEDIYISLKEPTAVEWREPAVTSPSAIDVIVTSSHGSSTSIIVSPSDYIISVTYHAMDTFGNGADCSFSISVTYDNEAPLVTMCPDDISEEISSSQEEISVVWKEPKVVDNSGNVSLLLQSHHSGSLFGLGETEIVYLWQDEAKNTAECKFKIQISKGNEDAVKATVTSAGMAEQDNTIEVPSTLIVILLSAFVILLVAIFVGIIIGKCVKCQCKPGNNSHTQVSNDFSRSMQMNKGIHYISPSQLPHPLPPPNHLFPPPVYTHYVTGNDSTPATRASSLYLEITSDTSDYSHYLMPGGTLGDVEPPPPPYRPPITQTASQ